MSIPEYHCTEGHAIQPKDWEDVEALRAVLFRIAYSDGINPGPDLRECIRIAREALGDSQS